MVQPAVDQVSVVVYEQIPTLKANVYLLLDGIASLKATQLPLLVQNATITATDLMGVLAASITSNLNMQVQANSNILATISQTITDADTLIQGLKRHWLLRSAFKDKGTNAPPAKATSPSSRVTSPKGGL